MKHPLVSVCIPEISEIIRRAACNRIRNKRLRIFMRRRSRAIEIEENATAKQEANKRLYGKRFRDLNDTETGSVARYIFRFLEQKQKNQFFFIFGFIFILQLVKKVTSPRTNCHIVSRVRKLI